MTSGPAGISGIALDVPPYRVDLDDWCDWTKVSREKIRNVVGHAFRMLGPQQSVYTMAANAVLRLIDQYEIDPARVRLLALGTESSTDNSAGAVIVKGMVNEALRQSGRAELARNCEVPEFKHACLGGIYALKSALRFLAQDGNDAQAIVVSSDVAIYQQNSSGEPTQGAGAVAMLVENDPKLAAIDLRNSGSASDYRGIDFRKPLQYRNGSGRVEPCRSLPVFNGKYSAGCYVDEMLHAMEHMYRRRNLDPVRYLRSLAAVFLHRPFRRMPETALGMVWLFALASHGASAELTELCVAAGVDPDEAITETRIRPDLASQVLSADSNEGVYPTMTNVLKAIRHTAAFRVDVLNKMSLGSDLMMELGNLYTASLPAWFAAGLGDALAQGIDLTGKEILLLGYGSGDAAEAIPVTMMPGWREAAAKINTAQALAGAIHLEQDQYLALREGMDIGALGYVPAAEFVVDHIGSRRDGPLQDIGVEYYRYIS